MFSGIIQALARVAMVERDHALLTIAVDFPPPQRTGLQCGASVAVNGVCLTVTRIAPPLVYFDIMKETQQRTTLSHLKKEDRVHIERSLRYGEEVGGHLISGHVQATGTVLSAQFHPGESFINIKVPSPCGQYLREKGFVAVHGVSLTVNAPNQVQGLFRVDLIPETLRRTIFAQCAPGTLLNVEFDCHQDTTPTAP